MRSSSFRRRFSRMCVCEREGVCVCERERVGKRERVCVCERECVCVCDVDTLWVRSSFCCRPSAGCVCVGEKE